MKLKHKLSGLPYIFCRAGALVVGGYAEYLLGKVDNFNDYDFIVPPNKWYIIGPLIPKTAKLNGFGGWRFFNNGIQIDIWPCSIEQYLRQYNGFNIGLVVDYINRRVFYSGTI